MSSIFLKLFSIFTINKSSWKKNEHTRHAVQCRLQKKTFISAKQFLSYKILHLWKNEFKKQSVKKEQVCKRCILSWLSVLANLKHNNFTYVLLVCLSAHVRNLKARKLFIF